MTEISGDLRYLKQGTVQIKKVLHFRVVVIPRQHLGYMMSETNTRSKTSIVYIHNLSYNILIYVSKYMHTNSRKSWGIEKYPRFEKQTRGFQKRETFPKLKPLKTAVEHMFSPCVFAQSAVLSLVLNYKNMKNHQTKMNKEAYNPAHTNPSSGTCLVRVWNNHE